MKIFKFLQLLIFAISTLRGCRCEAVFLWENFSENKNFQKLISTTIRPSNTEQNKSGLWSLFSVGSKDPNPSDDDDSRIDFLSKLSTDRVMEKLSQLVPPDESSHLMTSQSYTPMTTQMLTPGTNML